MNNSVISITYLKDSGNAYYKGYGGINIAAICDINTYIIYIIEWYFVGIVAISDRMRIWGYKHAWIK